MYKLVRIKINGSISNKVAALLTLNINHHNTVISYSEDYMPVELRHLVPKKKYCVKTADVVAVQILGRLEDVRFALDMLNEGLVRFVANFSDNGVDFEYIIGDTVTEDNAFVAGKGCLQGIHVFVDVESARAWYATGLIVDPLSPVITSKIFSHQIEESKGYHNLTNKPDALIPQQPRKLRREALKNIKDRDLILYEHTIDANGEVIDMELDVRFEDDLTCPITKEIFRDPVICSDGFTYERYAIETYLRINKISPMTAVVLDNTKLIPNISMRNIIRSIKADVKRKAEAKSDSDADHSKPLDDVANLELRSIMQYDKLVDLGISQPATQHSENVPPTIEHISEYRPGVIPPATAPLDTIQDEEKMDVCINIYGGQEFGGDIVADTNVEIPHQDTTTKEKGSLLDNPVRTHNKRKFDRNVIYE
jgi:hypothetical protein